MAPASPRWFREDTRATGTGTNLIEELLLLLLVSRTVEDSAAAADSEPSACGVTLSDAIDNKQNISAVALVYFRWLPIPELIGENRVLS